MMDHSFREINHLSPINYSNGETPKLPPIMSLFQEQVKPQAPTLSPLRNLNEILHKKNKYSPFRPVIPNRNSPTPSFLISRKPTPRKNINLSPKSRTKAEILNQIMQVEPPAPEINPLTSAEQTQALEMMQIPLNNKLENDSSSLDQNEIEFEEIILDEEEEEEEEEGKESPEIHQVTKEQVQQVQDVDEEKEEEEEVIEEQKQEQVVEECLVQGTIPSGTCTICSSESVEKKCLYCKERFCALHLPKHSPYPDKHNILPFKCSTCFSKKPIGGISFVEESDIEGPGCASLPPVIYQPNNLKEKPSQRMTDCLANVIRNEKVCLTTSIPENMKSYLLYPKKRAELTKSAHSVDGLSAVESFLVDNQCIYLHYKLDFSNVLEPIRYVDEKDLTNIEASNIVIQLLTRKAAVIEYAEDNPKIQKKVMRKFHVRLEMFVDRHVWNFLPSDQKNELYYLLRIIEDWFHHLLQELNFRRIIDGKNPFYLVSTRDCFRIKLLSESTEIESCNGEKFIKRMWYFPNDCIPNDYKVDASTLVKVYPDGTKDECWAAPVGVTTYHNVFNEDIMQTLENKVDELAQMSEAEQLKPNTAQPTVRFSKLVRTKFFFGARYLWQTHELQNGAGAKARGIRVDVDGLRNWIQDLVEEQLVERGIIEKDFVNQHAINIYHDGSEGIKQHFDDAHRFARPILSVRCFSPSRLCFGSLGFGMTNSLFFVPMERGCVTQLGPGYAADCIKHCIRGCDLVGKSATLLLRHVHEQLLEEAVNLLQTSVSQTSGSSKRPPTPSKNTKHKSKHPKRIPLKDKQNIIPKQTSNNNNNNEKIGNLEKNLVANVECSTNALPLPSSCFPNKPFYSTYFGGYAQQNNANHATDPKKNSHIPQGKENELH